MVGESTILDRESGWSMWRSSCRWILMQIGRGIVLHCRMPPRRPWSLVALSVSDICLRPSFITDKIGDDSKVVGRDAGRAGGFIPALCSSKRAERQLWQRPCVRAESKLWRSRQFRRSRQIITFWVRRTRYGARMYGDRTAIEDQ